MFRLVLLYWSLYLWDLPPGNEDDSSYNFFLKMNDAGLAGRAGGISSATVCVPCRLTSSWTRRNLPGRNKRQFMTRQPAINERSKSQNDSAIYKLNKGRKRKMQSDDTWQPSFESFECQIQWKTNSWPRFSNDKRIGVYVPQFGATWSNDTTRRADKRTRRLVISTKIHASTSCETLFH